MISFLRNHKISILIIIICFQINNIVCDVEYNKPIDGECKVNLQCQSGCCSSNKCVETKKCKDLRNKIYIIVAVVGVALVILFTINLFHNLCKIRKKFNDDVQKKADSEKEKENDNNKEKAQ